jgi:hypothetical protein
LSKQYLSEGVADAYVDAIVHWLEQASEEDLNEFATLTAKVTK